MYLHNHTPMKQRSDIMKLDAYPFDMEKIPVFTETDILVAGGGPGGLGAAVTAGRMGANVLLVEREAGPGGMSVYGEVSPIMGNHHGGVPMDRPVFMDWMKKMWKYRTNEMHAKCKEKEEFNIAIDPPQRIISKEMSLLAMEELLLEANVKLLYHHTLAGAEIKDGKIISAVFHSKSGFCRIKAKHFIDCTGDGDLAAFAGCEFEEGNEKGYCQPMTLCFKLGAVDLDRIPSKEEINRLYDQAKEEGLIHCPRENVLFFNALPERTLHFNTTRIIHKSGVKGKDLSDAEIEGRRQMREIYEFFKNSVPGFENCYISSIAAKTGVRESRRIIGKVYQTSEDFFHQNHYPDGIARMRYMLDIHNPDGSGTLTNVMPQETWYEIRYGALLPEGCRNLIMGCRAISCDHALFSSVRVMPQVCSLGQAAGMASSMALKKGVEMQDLSGMEVREELKKFGAFL